MQTDLGGEITPQTLTASYIYAARYGYSGTVLHNDNQIRLFPREGEGQNPIQTQLWTIPGGVGVEYSDRFGNGVHRVRIIEHHESLVIATAGQVSLATEYPVLEDMHIDDARGQPGALEYLLPSPLVDPDTVSALAFRVASGSDSMMRVIREVTGWVYTEIEYRRGTTDVATTADQVVAVMEGVCQDKTHLALGMLRALDIPCRYVSGLLTGQTGETHSWVEFMHPMHGWIGADPDERRHRAPGPRLRQAVSRTGLYGRLSGQGVLPLEGRRDRARRNRVRQVRRDRRKPGRSPPHVGGGIRRQHPMTTNTALTPAITGTKSPLSLDGRGLGRG